MKRIMINELLNYENQIVSIKGWVHRVRKLSKIAFLVIRDRSGMVQVIIDNDELLKNIKLEAVVSIEGLVVKSNNKISPIEIQVNNVQIISEVKEDLPIEVNLDRINGNLDTILNNRALSLRNVALNTIFKIQALLAQGFREYLIKEGFIEAFTPKIVAEGAEGGTAIFEIKYFEKKAYLAQSPQFYKQMMVGAGYERVFEVGSVYRAEEHNTNRHLNEYVSMDLEMGFIEDEKEIMKLETDLLRYMLNKLKIEGEEYLKILNIEVPFIGEEIPSLTLSEAMEILKKEYNKTDLEGDLDSEGEKLISQYAREKLNSEFIFLTDYPKEKRPMYTMPKGDNLTHSFDLLFRGLEITTGGQRIHNYEMLIENMISKGLNLENFHNYMELFKFGMPPHGGLAIGLERLTAQLIGLKNVREASLFPRDRTRITP
ncbi:MULTISPECIES: aspartate--tRNA(Asn) ligase [unclassified Clostridium]|uniref:aspartate--tRNA(Asn) ligase n=1 Tax=unclassified Clostridium TaxID=2614128 RepID=UPI0025B9C96C|nr:MULTISPECIES: aspartate--tRNA(Asn) ligase [unclassified Clostridium]